MLGGFVMRQILVVDDDVALANMIAASFRPCDVSVAHNAREALDLASTLPACDGREAVLKEVACASNGR